MHRRKERRQPFGAARSDAPPLHDVRKCVRDEMALLVEVSMIGTLHFSFLSRRAHRLHALLLGLRDDRIAVVAFVGDEMLGLKSVMSS